MIEMLQALGRDYKVIDDKKVGGTVVQVTLQIPSEGGQITFYRGKARCEAALSLEKSKQKSQVDKYR